MPSRDTRFMGADGGGLLRCVPAWAFVELARRSSVRMPAFSQARLKTPQGGIEELVLTHTNAGIKPKSLSRGISPAGAEAKRRPVGAGNLKERQG